MTLFDWFLSIIAAQGTPHIVRQNPIMTRYFLHEEGGSIRPESGRSPSVEAYCLGCIGTSLFRSVDTYSSVYSSLERIIESVMTNETLFERKNGGLFLHLISPKLNNTTPWLLLPTFRELIAKRIFQGKSQENPMACRD